MASLLIVAKNLTYNEYFSLLINSAGYLKLTEFELNKDYFDNGIISEHIYKKATNELLKFYNLNN
jgi:hypothetical protein